MTLTIDFTPAEEGQLRTAAQKEGIAPAELVRKLVTSALPLGPDENAVSIALLRSWLDEEATDDPDELQQAQREVEAFQHAINAERDRAGARQMYP
jgi:hypothetical protein